MLINEAYTKVLFVNATLMKGECKKGQSSSVSLSTRVHVGDFTVDRRPR